MQDKCFEKIEEAKRNQIKRIKNQEVGTRNSVLFLGLIQESRNLTTHGVNLFSALNDFFAYRKGTSH
jgi:hypothetical protein